MVLQCMLLLLLFEEQWRMLHYQSTVWPYTT